MSISCKIALCSTDLYDKIRKSKFYEKWKRLEKEATQENWLYATTIAYFRNSLFTRILNPKAFRQTYHDIFK